MIGETLAARATARGPLLARLALFSTASTALLASACTVQTTPPILVSQAPGAVVVDWTIRGSKDVGDCQVSGATTIHVALADSSGRLPMEYLQDCAAFATTIGGLVPDLYTGTVELLDASGNARTTSVNLAPFNVVANTTTTLGVDFPANSFF